MVLIFVVAVWGFCVCVVCLGVWLVGFWYWEAAVAVPVHPSKGALSSPRRAPGGGRAAPARARSAPRPGSGGDLGRPGASAHPGASCETAFAV